MMVHLIVIAIVLLCTGTQSFQLNQRFRRASYSPKKKQALLHVSGTQDIMEAFSTAFVGGTIGVMSVSVIVELRKSLDRSEDDCPYCMGNGEILCGDCYGAKMKGQSTCPTCGGRGLVMCLNCKGDGRITPLILQSRAVRDPVRVCTYKYQMRMM